MTIDKNTPTIRGEKKIWDAACVPRGHMTASGYQKVVLGLIFLKYMKFGGVFANKRKLFVYQNVRESKW